MNVLTLEDARENLDEVLQRVVDDHVPVAIARRKAEAVVIVSLSDWQARDETAYLLSSPRNAERLLEGIRQLDAGEGIERDLIEP